jgi:hypothetical protein
MAGGLGREVPHMPQKRYSGLFSYPQCGQRKYKIVGITDSMMTQFYLRLAELLTA